MKLKSIFMSVLGILGAVFCVALLAEVKVGIYGSSYGATGIYEGIKNEKDISAEMIQNLNSETLFKYDTVILGSVQYLSATDVHAIRTYTVCGGGVLFHHNTCSLKEALFPEICRGLQKSGSVSFMPIQNTIKPLLENMPAEYPCTYLDYMGLEKGADGTVVVNGKNRFAAVIAGKFGDGYVVANGAAVGLSPGNGEVAPSQGEKLLLLNSVKWAGANRLSGCDKTVIEEKQKKYQELKELKEFQVWKKEKAQHENAWFDSDFLKCSFLENTPVNELDGKYFLIARLDGINGLGYNRTRLVLRQLRRMGVTDIIQLQLRGNIVYHPSEIPGADVKYKDYDSLMVLVEAAHKENMDVWIKFQLWTSENIASKNIPSDFLAKDSEGKPYIPHRPDLAGKNFRQFVFNCIDELADKYNKYGNLKGVYYDMPFINGDYYEDDIALFSDFTEKNFGEKAPSDIAKNFAKGKNWCEPGNKWWRRYVLFSEWVSENYLASVKDYCNKRGLEFSIQIDVFGSRWDMGHNEYRQSKLGKWMFVYPGSDREKVLYVYKNCYAGTFAHWSYGRYLSYGFNGNDSAISFPQQHYIEPFYIGNTNQGICQVKKNIRNVKEWKGAENLSGAAILTNMESLRLGLGNNVKDEHSKQLALYAMLTYHEDISRIFVQDTDLYKKYRVLIALPWSVYGLDEKNMEALKKYIEDGGVVISVNSQWTVSRPDFTELKDISRDMTGVEYNGNPKDSEEQFPYTVRQIGKGKVITFSDTSIENAVGKQNKKVESILVELMGKYVAAPVKILENGLNSKYRVRIMNTLKKKNWIGISLYSEDLVPASCKLQIDIKALGLDPQKEYRVLLLGREMEMRGPGSLYGGKLGKANFWKAEDFIKGIKVNILENSQADLKLPGNLEAEFSNKLDLDYVKQVQKAWEKDSPQRTSQYEILVIAPADELDISGEKI